MTPAIRDAVILTSEDDATRRVAGVPLLLRTVLVLQRSGVERCTLVGPGPTPRDPRIRCAVTSATRLAAASDDTLRLVIDPGSVVDEALVRDLQRRARPGQAIAFSADGVRVRVVPGTHLLDDGGGGARPPEGTLTSASAPPAQVEQALLRALENPRDGYVDRLLYRRLSRPLTRLLLRTPLTPNAVTVIGVAIGIGGGLAIGAESELGILGGVLALVLSGVLDCCDGEIARIKLTESKLGHVLDVTGDTLVHVALLTGIAKRLAKVAAWPGSATLGLLGFGVIASFAAITWSEQTEARRQAVDAWENRVLESVLSPLTTRDWHVFPVAFALAGRLDELVPAAAWGAQAFWITVVVLVWRVLRRA
ncbi:MAG TPA: CDP-alcohol phosphatidyltransferase family protein [Candidatus Eisenbacteria bacterium]|nr:CDP-alcohol phosphatidyltransferase family protein [Candidatus Eisenbacteria bacterium]